MARCQWDIKHDEGFLYDLPGCLGGAVHGRNGCTCYSPKFNVPEGDEKDEIEKENSIMRALVSSQSKKIQKLSKRVADLEFYGLGVLQWYLHAGEEESGRHITECKL